MTILVGAREARSRFSNLLARVHWGGETVIIQQSGKSMAAMISMELFQCLVAEREARFQALDKLRSACRMRPRTK